MARKKKTATKQADKAKAQEKPALGPVHLPPADAGFIMDVRGDISIARVSAAASEADVRQILMDVQEKSILSPAVDAYYESGMAEHWPRLRLVCRLLPDEAQIAYEIIGAFLLDAAQMPKPAIVPAEHQVMQSAILQAIADDDADGLRDLLVIEGGSDEDNQNRVRPAFQLIEGDGTDKPRRSWPFVASIVASGAIACLQEYEAKFGNLATTDIDLLVHGRGPLGSNILESRKIALPDLAGSEAVARFFMNHGINYVARYADDGISPYQYTKKADEWECWAGLAFDNSHTTRFERRLHHLGLKPAAFYALSDMERALRLLMPAG